MDVGVQVREISTGAIGVIEKGNNSNGYFVNFGGGRKNWKRKEEIETISNTIKSNTVSGTVSKQPALPSGPAVKKVSPPSSTSSVTGPKPIVSSPSNTTPKAQSEDPGPRFGNFKFNTTQTLSTSPKYSTLPSRAFFDVSSTPTTPAQPTSNTVKKPVATVNSKAPARAPIPDFLAPHPTPTLNKTSPPVTPKQPVQSNPNPVSPRQPPPPPTQSKPVAVQPISPRQPPAITTPPPPPVTSSVVNEDMWNIKFNELELEREIGCGKYGEVYLGKWLGTPVAIKKLLDCNEETNPIIERELQILKDIRHPQIVQFLGVSKNGDEPEVYIVTEFMEGGDLFDSLIFGDAPLKWKDRIRIAQDIAQSCVYLQKRGILHRDLKSQNILLSSNKRAKLCDLGLARVFDDRINKRLTYVGSDRWMAPEIAMGEQYDYKIDVFSFGIVLVEIITSQIPDERNPMKRFAFDAPLFMKKVPKECPPAFSKLCIDCTLSDPKQRPSFTQILKVINDIYESLPDDEEEELNE